jgi:hypothetical protein
MRNVLYLVVCLDLLLGVAYPHIGTQLFTYAVAAESRTQRLVTVKYRHTPVNLEDPRFEYLDTSRSSFVNGAWYDAASSYMIIRLRGTYYHYCRMPWKSWKSFRGANSFGKHYNALIKGNFDCRLGGVPSY